MEIRKRRPRHRTLERIDAAVASAREGTEAQRLAFNDKFDAAERAASDAMQKELAKFENRIRELQAQGDPDSQQATQAMQAIQQLASSQRLAQRKLDTTVERLRRERDAGIEEAERSLETTIRREQDRQKWLAVILPPIPPLVVAFFVFFRRRALEREGVAKSRLR
jgi:ABC-2 type transport system permease protein